MKTFSSILIAWTSNVYAAEILGYPIVAKQAKFYSIILGVIAASVAMVSISYLCFWLKERGGEMKTLSSILIAFLILVMTPGIGQAGDPDLGYRDAGGSLFHAACFVLLIGGLALYGLRDWADEIREGRPGREKMKAAREQVYVRYSRDPVGVNAEIDAEIKSLPENSDVAYANDMIEKFGGLKIYLAKRLALDKKFGAVT